MEKTKTGIKGLDELIQGGFPLGSRILLSGTPGTGKTIFGLEYLHNGAKKFDEPGLYVSFEEESENIREQASQFGWDLKELERQQILIIISIPPSEITNNTIADIIRIIEKHSIKRLVIDSISTLSLNTPSMHVNANSINEFAVKHFIYSFIDKLKKLKNTTALLISHAHDNDFSKDYISEFISDGIIHITFESMGGEFSRSLLIRKMRRVKNDEDIHPLEISSKGIIIHNIK